MTMSSMNCSRNDVVLLPIPFSDLTSRKVLPAIVIGKQRSDVFVVPISSQLANTDWQLMEWSAAGLNMPCGVKAQVATVEEQRVIKIVGKLQPRDIQMLNSRLRVWLQL
jgi:PemK-like, MazF-like toxin of type II toxin-antitoxin system